MRAKRTPKDSFSVVGVGAAACVACCVPLVVALLGGVGIAGIASAWVFGGGGLAIAVLVAAATLLTVRRRQQACASAGPSAEAVSVSLVTKADR